MEGFESKSLTELYRLYLATEDDAEAEVLLGEILARLLPIITKFFHNKPKSENYTESDAEDLVSETLLKLTIFLRLQRESILVVEIENFEAYLYSICRSVFADFWRKKFADYSNLTNRIRYLFKNEPQRFSIWMVEKRQLCSLIKPKNIRSVLSNEAILELVKTAIPNHQIESENILVNETLRQANGWLYFNNLVAIIAKLLGVKNLPRHENTEDSILEGFANDTDNLEETHNNRAKLLFLWNEIRELERLQKLCLLYNIRDKQGREVNTMWFECQIATLLELAEQFEVSETEMAPLLAVLPFPDVQIASILGISKDEKLGKVSEKNQKVSNLRKVARENLKRRMEGKRKRVKSEK
jgi:hypothetical protein